MADQRCGTCKWMSADITSDKRYRCVAPYPFWVRNADEWGYDIDGVLPEFAYKCETYTAKEPKDDKVQP